MLKKRWILLLAIIIGLLVIPNIKVSALTESVVHDQAEFLEALQNKEVSTIILGNDIETTQKINITRQVTVDGDNHTMKYVGTFGEEKSSDNKVWGGIYLLQIYKTVATVKDIKLTGGNAAILVNGGTVKLLGNVDVSGNGFGGIELSQGKGVTNQSRMIIDDDTNLVNTTETADTPTMWVPSDSKDAVVEMDGELKTIKSGAELSLTEIESLFSEVSPETSDKLNIIIMFGIMGMALLFFSVSHYKKNLN